VSTPISPLALSSYRYIDVTGVDAERFLQGQITINVSTPEDKTAYLAALCNAKGRIVSLFFISKIKLGFRLFMPQSIIKTTIEHLKKYGVFFKVTIEEAPAEARLIAFIENPNESNPNNRIKITNTDLSLKSFPNEGELKPLTTSNSIYTANSNCTQNDEFEWYWHLAQNKIPWINQDSVEQFLPHDLNLPKLDAVDFKKGCYTGQEIIARMHYKGKLKQHLQLLKGEFTPTILAKTALTQEDKKVGEVVCSICIKEKGVLVLALVKDKADIDDFFQLEDKNSPILKIEK